MKKVLVFLAEGFEEVEAVTPIDFLRRAGVEVTTAGIGGKYITGGHGISVEADVELSGLKSGEVFDGLVFPGGMPGASNIAAEPGILSMITEYNRRGAVIAAICASPGVILAKTGVLDGRTATCYPGFEKNFGPSTKFSSERLVTDGNIVTSRGAGTAAEFSIELIKIFADHQTAENIKKGTIQNF